MAGAAADMRPTVLVVDDDPDVLNSLQFAFEVEGFKVLAFASGEALLADPLPVDHGCLVLDFELGGIDGLALLARLRDQGCSLPAILITTGRPAVMLKAARAGTAVVEKPLLCDRLVGEVRRLIDAPPVHH
jgi:two-component system CheB/CheR fusion protein